MSADFDIDEYKQEVMSYQAELRMRFDRLNDSQKAEFTRRWGIVNTIPPVIRGCDEDISTLQELIKDGERNSKSGAFWGLAIIAALYAWSFLTQGELHFPEWAKVPLYIWVALYLYSTIFWQQSNRQILAQAIRRRTDIASQIYAVGVIEEDLVKLSKLIALKNSALGPDEADKNDLDLLDLQGKINRGLISQIEEDRSAHQIDYKWTNYYY